MLYSCCKITLNINGLLLNCAKCCLRSFYVLFHDFCCLQAVKLILAPKTGEPEAVRAAKLEFLSSGSAGKALQLMPTYYHVECTVLRGLARQETPAPRQALL